MSFKWKLEYCTKRPDNMWEARYMEEEGLFTIGVMTTEKSAIAEAKRKIVDGGTTNEFVE